jgi:hypothetical protein
MAGASTPLRSRLYKKKSDRLRLVIHVYPLARRWIALSHPATSCVFQLQVLGICKSNLVLVSLGVRGEEGRRAGRGRSEKRFPASFALLRPEARLIPMRRSSLRGSCACHS